MKRTSGGVLFLYNYPSKVLWTFLFCLVISAFLVSGVYAGKVESGNGVISEERVSYGSYYGGAYLGEGGGSVDLYSCFVSAGNYYSIDPYLLMSIGWVESRFNPRALNRNRDGSYDLGIMQVNTRWKSYLKKFGIELSHLWDPCYNIHVGAMILRHCIDNHGYSWKAVDCYNKGVRKARSSSKYVWKVYHTLKRYAQLRAAEYNRNSSQSNQNQTGS